MALAQGFPSFSEVHLHPSEQHVSPLLGMRQNSSPHGYWQSKVMVVSGMKASPPCRGSKRDLLERSLARARGASTRRMKLCISKGS